MWLCKCGCGVSIRLAIAMTATAASRCIQFAEFSVESIHAARSLALFKLQWCNALAVCRRYLCRYVQMAIIGLQFLQNSIVCHEFAIALHNTQDYPAILSLALRTDNVWTPCRFRWLCTRAQRAYAALFLYSLNDTHTGTHQCSIRLHWARLSTFWFGANRVR